MKIYVASSWRNERQPEVVKRLREAGHSVYDFRNPPNNSGFGWEQLDCGRPPWSAERTRFALQIQRAQEGFDADLEGMKWADAIVMVQPCGRSAALELGWGAGAGKLCFALLADGQEPELMLKVAHLCTSVEELSDVLAHAENLLTHNRRLDCLEDRLAFLEERVKRLEVCAPCQPPITDDEREDLREQVRAAMQRR